MSEEEEQTDQYSSALNEFCGFEGVGGFVVAQDDEEELSQEMNDAAEPSAASDTYLTESNIQVGVTSGFDFDAFHDGTLETGSTTKLEDFDAFDELAPTEDTQPVQNLDEANNVPSANESDDFGVFDAFTSADDVNTASVQSTDAFSSEVKSAEIVDFDAVNSPTDQSFGEAKNQPILGANDDFGGFGAFSLENNVPGDIQSLDASNVELVAETSRSGEVSNLDTSDTIMQSDAFQLEQSCGEVNKNIPLDVNELDAFGGFDAFASADVISKNVQVSDPVDMAESTKPNDDVNCPEVTISEPIASHVTFFEATQMESVEDNDQTDVTPDLSKSDEIGGYGSSFDRTLPSSVNHEDQTFESATSENASEAVVSGVTSDTVSEVAKINPSTSEEDCDKALLDVKQSNEFDGFSSLQNSSTVKETTDPTSAFIGEACPPANTDKIHNQNLVVDDVLLHTDSDTPIQIAESIEPSLVVEPAIDESEQENDDHKLLVENQTDDVSCTLFADKSSEPGINSMLSDDIHVHTDHSDSKKFVASSEANDLSKIDSSEHVAFSSFENTAPSSVEEVTNVDSVFGCPVTNESNVVSTQFNTDEHKELTTLDSELTAKDASIDLQCDVNSEELPPLQSSPSALAENIGCDEEKNKLAAVGFEDSSVFEGASNTIEASAVDTFREKNDNVGQGGILEHVSSIPALVASGELNSATDQFDNNGSAMMNAAGNDFGEAANKTPSYSVPSDGLNPVTDDADNDGTAIANSTDDDFDGFASFEEAVDESSSYQVPSDELDPATTSFDNDGTAVTNADTGDFGGFATFEEAAYETSSHLVTSDGLNPAINDSGNECTTMSYADGDDVGGFASFEEVTDKTPSHSVPSDGLNPATGDAANDGVAMTNAEEGDFGGFASFEEAVDETSSHLKNEDFGEFGSFEEVPSSNHLKTQLEDIRGNSVDCNQTIADADGDHVSRDKLLNQSTPKDAAVEVENDDFGDFGSFEEVHSAETHPVNNDTAETRNEDKTLNQSTPKDAAVEVDDDDFGDFGSFEGVHSAETYLVNNNDTIETHDEDFGDFGDFEEVPSVNTGEKEQAAPVLPKTILDESIREMFKSVFEHGEISQVDSSKEPALPFDVTIRSVMPDQCTNKTQSDKSFAKSAEGLSSIKQFLMGLPKSPAISILSAENWNPHSQYMFNEDGSPIIEFVEMHSTSSIPEVLCIDLPTGFDASEFSRQPIGNKNDVSICKLNAAAVDSPIEEFPEDTKRASNESKPQLSSSGQNFLNRIPDLSYMLSTTLNLNQEL